MKKFNLLCLLLVFALSPVYVYGEKEKSTNKKQSVDNQSSFQSNIQSWLKIGFTPKEKNIIKQYFEELITKGEKKSKTKKKSLPPGLAKKLARGGTLPPGWQMKVARGEVMDYEVYSQGQLLPEEILKKLPLGPDGTVLLKIGGKVVRLLEATRTIVDLFDLQPNEPDK